MTEKRAAILDILREGGHLQPDEIYRRAKQAYPGMVLATVYNNLHALCEEGLIRHIHTARGADYYDRTPTPHEHAICAMCGKMIDLEIDAFPSFIGGQTDLPMLSYDFILHTVCPECSE